MPSSDDIIDTNVRARELAVEAIVKRERCSYDVAHQLVTRMSKEEIARLIGWPHPGQPYSSW